MSPIVTLRTRDDPTDLDTADGWTPVSRWFEQFHRRFFDDAGTLPWIAAWDGGSPGTLSTDVLDLGDRLEVRADLPGVPKENIDIRIHGTTLRIQASHQSESEAQGATYLRRERSARTFDRRFELPEPVLAAQVTARLENGVLTVSVPKPKPAAEEKVPVA